MNTVPPRGEPRACLSAWWPPRGPCTLPPRCVAAVSPPHSTASTAELCLGAKPSPAALPRVGGTQPPSALRRLPLVSHVLAAHRVRPQEELRAFFEGVMASTGAAVAPGPPIASVKVSSDRSYAFLELRSVEEASNAMAFDGILFNGVNLKIRRPSNYNPEEAAPLGPDCPDPCVATAHLAMCKTVVEDTWDKIFVGGLPCNYGDEQVKELLAPYGSLKSFNLVMDKNTGKSKGYAFCEFSDPRVIPQVINGLHMQVRARWMPKPCLAKPRCSAWKAAAALVLGTAREQQAATSRSMPSAHQSVLACTCRF
ncbi:hypothetical protein COO60DRAFT_1299308 [Scenedesmus sp. NREL 46B-D3]|nr:hypothetical protein COO60DRAFT_1299308 [Scenedesmus sp. NREL 46B-D3]